MSVTDQLVEKQCKFAELKRQGYAMGFRHVESGPLVRSSYHASDAVSTSSPPVP